MGFRTFLGPLLVGTQKWGAGRNTGTVVTSQSLNSGDLTGAVVGNVDTAAFVIPRGAQLLDVVIDQITASATGTTTVSVGLTSGAADVMAAVATTAGGRFRGVATAATQAAWQISTTADQTLFVRNATGTATLTAGRYIITVMYAVRADDGTQFPAQG